MKILITGTGLIGCYTAAQLIDAGHEVVLLDVSPHDEYINNVLQERKVTVRTGDIINVGQLPELQPSHQGKRIEMVVHTAGIIGGNARANPYAAMRTNLIGTIEVAEAARSVGVQRIVYASTHGVYALEKIRKSPFQEDAPVTADSVYGATKLSSEHVLQAFGETFGMQIVALRFTNIYGYGEFVGGSSGGNSFQQLIMAALNNVKIPIPPSLNGNGEWLYVKDAAIAIQMALEHPLTKLFTLANIGSGVLHDENEIVKSVKAQLPQAQFLTSKIADAPPRSTERYQPFDLGTAQNEIGFYPKFSLDEGIRDYIEEFKRIHA